MFNRLITVPSRSCLLFGARGTGKTTWALSEFCGRPYFDLLDRQAYANYQIDASLFGRQLAALPSGEWIVVDEIQRIPDLLNEVHRAIEGRNQRFLLLGSSARKLRRAGVNLLGGRASLRTLYPLLPAEMGDEFDLETALRFGTLPVVWTAEDRTEALNAYTAAYVTEEIRAEALVRDLGSFSRFLSIASLFHGQTLNINAVARDSAVARMTAEGYFSVLEDTLLTWRLPAYEARPRVRERAHPKLYWIDAGIVRTLKGGRGPLIPEERGALSEGWVANTLRATLAYEGGDVEMSYLPRHERLGEVDFILRRGDEVVAIEVKSSPRLDSTMLKGLRTARDLPGLRRRLLVCGVSRPEQTDDGITVWPFAHFGLHCGSADLFGD